ncbi:MAG: nuclear transport factor 2 family protein [Actinomycetota bacterium]|nr:nuclear transport factor 2 family protein [Actinomycetota bacterium]
MIRATIERWHEALRGESAFEDLLHEDCVFWSPVLFRPMEGRDLTALYLRAAYQVFPGDGADATNSSDGPSGFRYTKRVLDGNHAVLEFETTMDGVSVNGVDIITCDDDGLITEFKVMIRPRKAVEKVQAQMAAMLEQMPPATGV